MRRKRCGAICSPSGQIRTSVGKTEGLEFGQNFADFQSIWYQIGDLVLDESFSQSNELDETFVLLPLFM